MSEPRENFTVARANRALPLVARVAGDIVARFAEMRRLAAERQGARGEARETIERRLFDLEGELERHAQELAGIGCELKDPARGLLDFPARRGSEPILLCWMAGEASVGFWHPRETGFDGRRPVAELPAETLGK
jgi:hypothetical protein